jgi:hypothetical protein
MTLKIILNGARVVEAVASRLGLAAGLLVSAVAFATPRPLPFTYGTDSLATGNIELEQFVDMTPVRPEAGDGFSPWVQLITEVEVGITDKLELGLYYQALAEPGDGLVAFDGIKQRLRYRLADLGEWPIDVAFYAEVAEMHDELELEGKVLLQRRFGRARVMVNLWAEREFHYSGGGAWVLNPTAGAVYEVRPWFQVGIEAWVHGELGVTGETPGFNEDFHGFVGPTFMVAVGNLWWSVAPYVRLDGFGRGAQRGDEYGRVWIRSVVGLSL